MMLKNNLFNSFFIIGLIAIFSCLGLKAKAQMGLMKMEYSVEDMDKFPVSDFEKMNLKRNPKWISYDYSAIEDRSGSPYAIYRFTEQGFIYNIEYLNDARMIEAKDEFVYNYNYLMLEKGEFEQNDNRKLKIFRKHSYEADGMGYKQIGMKMLNRFGGVEKLEKYEYDDADNRILTVGFDKIKDTLSKEKFKYDDKKRVVESISFNSLNEQMSRWEYFFNDSLNKVVKKIYRDKSDAVAWTYLYEYNENKDESIITMENSSGITVKKTVLTYKYDPFKNWVEKIEMTTFPTDDINPNAAGKEFFSKETRSIYYYDQDQYKSNSKSK